ncbi:MAG: competence/damage-inducible protein A [Rikenellaceae bacterium]
MRAKIVTIGDEILIGQIHDTNSTYIAQQLSAAGFVVCEKISIGDGREQILSTLTAAMQSADVVIVTGGLGPTKDDITKHTLADMFGCALRYDEAVGAHVKWLLGLRGVEFNELNRGQAEVPECCEVLHNAHGTAPGMWFEREGSVLISLPGVPFEMKALIADVVVPKLSERFETRASVHRTLITAGLPESILAKMIEGWEDALPEGLKLAYLPSAGRVRLRLSAYDVESAESVAAVIEQQFDELARVIPDNILGFEGVTMEQLVHDRLIERGETLGVAESCTGGALAAKFTAMAGASAYFMGGVVSYSNDAKVDLLGVRAESIERYGAVSEQVAIEMAEGVRRAMRSDYGVSTTGIAGPSGGTEQKPVGTVWIGVATPERSFALHRHCGTERSQMIMRSVAEALAILHSEQNSTNEKKKSFKVV